MERWGNLVDIALMRIAFYLSGTTDGSRGIQAMLATCRQWNRVVRHEALCGKRQECMLVRRALATGYFLKAMLDYPGVGLQLEYNGNLRRSFRFEHCPRLTCTRGIENDKNGDDVVQGTSEAHRLVEPSLIVVRPDKTRRRDRVRLLSIVSRGVSVMNALDNKVQTEFDEDGNAWFTLNRKVLRVRNNSKFRAGKSRYVQFLDRKFHLTQRFNKNT